MKTFPLVISSPDGNVWEGEAYMLSVRGIAGELAVMAGHIPFITSLVPCECKIDVSEDTDLVGKIDGGLLTVSPDRVTLLCGSFEMLTK